MLRNLLKKQQKDSKAVHIIHLRDETDLPVRAIEADTSLADFYNKADPFEITTKDSADYKDYLDGLEGEQVELLNSEDNYYQLTFKNIGGIVMPLVIEFEFENGEKQLERVPAEIWRYNANRISRVFVFDKKVKRVVLDPHRELVDANYNNNARFTPVSFDKIELVKQKKSPPNPMQLKKKAEELKKTEEDQEDESEDS